MAASHEMAVVSVEYRLAPETPHPGPGEDCYAGLVWTANQVVTARAAWLRRQLDT